MTRFQIDSDALFSATTSVRASISRIQAEVAALHGQLTDLQQSWSGPASAAFQTVLAEWRLTQQRVEENLAAINQALALAGQQYADTEQHNARLFGR